jgi:hypothetical protein
MFPMHLAGRYKVYSWHDNCVKGKGDFNDSLPWSSNMTRLPPLPVVLLTALLSLGAGSARADIVVGGISFADNAFADVLLNSSGSFTISGAPNLEAAITGSDVNSYAFSFSPGAFVELGFTDNVLVNGLGADLAIFELGVPDTVAVTIGATTLSYLTVFTGFSAGGFDLNVALINLDDFGVAPGATLTSNVIGLDIQGSGTVPSLAAVGALNSANAEVPEPASLALWSILGTAGIAAWRRKRKATAA